MLYLQLRKDIVEERLKCDDSNLMSLAGLALQVEYGDCDQTALGRNYFQAEQYIPNAVVRRLGSSYVYSEVREKHNAHAGIGFSQGEIEFIKVCCLFKNLSF